MRESSVYRQIVVEGKEKGRILAKVEIALNLLSEGFPVECASRLTGLSIDLVQELSNSLKAD